MNAKDYFSELVNYGGEWLPRSAVYADLIRTATAAGAPNPQACADRWMQGNAR
jgi:hypothetical protein